MKNGVICVVGGKNYTYPYMSSNKFRFFHDTDPDNFYYCEMCGHKFLLNVINKLMDCPYVGLEHYKRAFDLSPAEITDILSSYDILVKEKHGPFLNYTNLSVLGNCPRAGKNSLQWAERQIDRYPELEEQANNSTHYGCNMFITTPSNYKIMMEDEFHYIEEILSLKDVPKAALGYFCETILTPYIINKYNKNIYIAPVIVQ